MIRIEQICGEDERVRAIRRVFFLFILAMRRFRFPRKINKTSVV